MKEIKFRAWDGKKMHYENELMICFNGVLVLRDKKSVKGKSSCQRLCNGMYEIMQWTGCKDRNRKEIYEGDIVKSKNIEGTCIVKWCDNAYYIVESTTGSSTGMADSRGPFGVKVIGNIFENPKLLKEEK